MVVPVRGRDLLERLAAVAALPEIEVVDVHRVAVLRVGGNVCVVPGAREEVLVVADLLPGLALVVGAVESPLGPVLNERPDPPSPGRRGAHPDLADGPGRQAWAFGDVGPGVAAVGAPPETAVRPAAADLPEGTKRLPDGRVEDARIRLVDAEIHRAGLLADEEHLLPGCSAVLALEDAALHVLTEGVTERGDPDHIRVRGVDADLADVAGVPEANVGPGTTGVGAPVDPVAVGDVDADRGLARAGVEHVRVGRGDGERADGRRGEEAVGDAPPVDAGVGRLPDTPGHPAEVEGVRVVVAPGDRDHPAAPERTDAAPLEQSIEVQHV